MLRRNAKELTHELKGHWYGSYGVAFCPAHKNSKTPALSIGCGKNGKLLLNCKAGCSYADVKRALLALDMYPDSATVSPDVRKNNGKSRIARRIWEESDTVLGTAAERYLRTRGISCSIPDTLRFHPNCRHCSGKHYPALIARLDGGSDFAIQRTFLSRCGQGKARVVTNRMMLGSCVGGAVHLSRGEGALVIAEGIETGLSLRSGLLRDPIVVWAALSTSGMKSLSLPSTPRKLIVAPDADDPGMRAARTLAEKAHRLGWAVQWFEPPEGKDWNDVLLERNENDG
ncbi:MAG: toprim domain-containing protein [Henriciella sp.]|nr:toprim domain-containing protein [Henriciella sp.]MBO6694963.1 toprim domain-containing protein [Henriciella sp.]